MPEQNPNPRALLFRDRNFRWLISGGLISMLGDQFTLIALPWLVLKMTGDTLALGMVLAIMSIPRALFMLIGGALVDRYSPKQVQMLTKYVNTILLGTLAVLVLCGSLTLWMIYVLAFAIGLSTAFSIPSASAMLPHVIGVERLQAANGILLGLRQFTMFAGPVLAGLLIAVFGEGGETVSNARGLGIAFLLDALSFAVSAWTLSNVNTRQPAASMEPHQSVLKSVASGLRFCWNDLSLRTCFLYWAAVAFFISGPIQVAMPVLAGNLEHGAAGFGILVGAHGAGTLLGMIVSGIRPTLRIGSLGATMLAVDFIIGALFIPVGHISAIWQGGGLLLIIGILGGFLHVVVYTWMQQRVPRAMLGRIMSIFMFIFMGIAPISSAITGWLMRSIAPHQLFTGSGVLLIVIVLIALAVSPMRGISDLRTSQDARP